MLSGLTANTAPDPATGFAPFGSSGLIWAYDSFGNLQSETLASGSSMSLPQPAASVYDANNRVMGYSYDASGNLKSDLLRGSSSYQYDAENRISLAFGSTAYIYDAEGNRVAKESVSGGVPTLTNQYILGLGGEQVTEIDGNGNWLHSNVYEDGKLLATYDTTGLHFHFSDWLGSRRMQASGTGTVDETCQSLPFGDQLNCTGPASDATEQHFTGKVRDNESGLDYFGARYYQSNAGRWMSPDWADKPEAVPYSSLGNPQSLNLYGYVGNNPLSNSDADGHVIWCPKCLDLAARAAGWLKEKLGSGESHSNPGIVTTTEVDDVSMTSIIIGSIVQSAERESEDEGGGNPAVVEEGEELELGPLETMPTPASPDIHPSEISGKTPSEIDATATSKGLIPKGPDPQNGQGSYVDPVTGQQRVLSHPNADPPHAHVNDPTGQRLGPNGQPVPTNSPEAHLPIKKDN
jgi:RHS repeat-associated protein